MMTPLYTKSHSNFAAWCKGVRGERCNAGVDQHRFAWSGWYEYKTRTRKDENGLTKREAAKYRELQKKCHLLFPELFLQKMQTE